MNVLLIAVGLDVPDQARTGDLERAMADALRGAGGTWFFVGPPPPKRRRLRAQGAWVNVRAEPGGRIVGALRVGDAPVDVVGEDRRNGATWYQIAFKDRHAWVSSQAAVVLEEVTG